MGMTTGLSAKVVQEVKKILPEVRNHVMQEFDVWNTPAPGTDFYSDDKVIQTLPGAAYEYLIVAWGINPSRIDERSVIYVMDNRLFNDIKKITAHALRRLLPLRAVL